MGTHEARLLSQAAALCGDPTTAEDLAAETVVEAWKSLDRWDGTCRFGTWLYAILLHRHKKWLRRARSRPLSLAWLPFFVRDDAKDRHRNLPAQGPLPSEAADHNEVVGRVWECVEALPEKHREVILLRFFEDASLSDMAGVLGCSPGTVKSRLHHALQKLRKMRMNRPGTEGDALL